MVRTAGQATQIVMKILLLLGLKGENGKRIINCLMWGGGGRRYLKVVGLFSSLFSRLREAYSEIIGTTDDC